MQPEPKRGEPLSTSMFYMWRVIIALAHADGRVQQEERTYLERIFRNMDRVHGLTAEQKAAFAADLETPQSIPDLMRYINDPSARGQLIYFGWMLARADGIVDPREKDILDKLRADQLASLDMDRIRAETREHVTSEMFRHDVKMQEYRPQKGLSGALDAFLLRFGIDLMED